MKDNQVFFESNELERLHIQKRLFSTHEQGLYQKLLKGENLCVLDIGCNDGDKTAEKFAVDAVAKVVGLEYHRRLAEAAQAKYGSDKFSFHQCNVEAPDFVEKLESVMARQSIGGFDIIHLSLVLMHLTDPPRLLKILKRFLNPGGKVLILESEDAAVKLVPDPEGLLDTFLQWLKIDVFAGDRTLSAKLASMLSNAGYVDIETLAADIRANDIQEKEAIFDVFFSYLQPDIRVLRQQEPHNAAYAACDAWLDAHIDKLHTAICTASEQVSIGVKMFVAYGGNDGV